MRATSASVQRSIWGKISTNIDIVVGDVVPREKGYEFLRCDRGICFGNAGEVGNAAKELLGRVMLAEFAQVESLVAFAESLPLLIAKEGEMDETGWREAEQAVEVELLRDRGEEVASAHHFGNAHECVIHDDRELVCPSAIGPAKDEVAALLFKVNGERAVVAIGNCQEFGGSTEAYRRGTQGLPFAYEYLVLGPQFGSIDHSAVGFVRG